MMKLNDFIDKLNLASNNPSIYTKGGWGKWNGSKFEFDCVCLIKSILWSWNGTRAKHGGAVYGSNGVPDIGTETLIAQCDNISSDFSNLGVGELVWMQGHVGIHIGDNIIIEATTAFGGGVVRSKINSKGQRLNYKTGVNAGPDWKKHGYLPYVDYSASKADSFLPKRGYFKKGDISENVGKIANFMYKTFPVYTSKNALGNLYGDNLIKAIKEFQRRTGLEADGCTGQITLSKLVEFGFKY